MNIRELMTTMDYGPAPESRAEAMAWLDAHDRRFGLFIGGAFCEPLSGAHFATVNPATAEPLAEVALADLRDVAAAVAAGRAAPPGWAARGGARGTPWPAATEGEASQADCRPVLSAAAADGNACCSEGWMFGTCARAAARLAVRNGAYDTSA